MGSELLDYFKGDKLPTSVWFNKYAQEGEVTPDDMHHRMAKEFARVEEKYRQGPCAHDNIPLSKYGETRTHLTEEKIFGLFKDFKYIIPQGSVMSQLGARSIGSLSNCFVIGQPHDSYGGIMLKDQEQVQLMKRRGGVGIDISTLRPEGVNTSNAAKTSTGAISFMHRFSNSTREVAQNGRRGALMISMDVNHPDILGFATIKRDLTQVTGANISIKLNADFMKAVGRDQYYIHRFPCDRSIAGISTNDFEYGKLIDMCDIDGISHIKKSKARELWNEIIKSAHMSAEPGLMYWDNMVNYSPDGVYPQFKQVTTNPCSEIGMQEYDACRLLAMNLFSYVVNPFTKHAYFDFKAYYRDNYEAQRLADDLVDLEIEHIDRILDKIGNDPEPWEVKQVEFDLWNKVRATAQASRRTGLGYTGLADALAALGLKYDSDEGIAKIEEIMYTKMESELDCTIDMAITRGTFEGWDPILETNPFYTFLDETYPEQASRMDRFGRRNVSWSCIAPTGSLSIIAKAVEHSNISSGLEPVFSPFHMRRKKVNASDPDSRVDFTDQNGDTWQEYPVVMGAFKDWVNIVHPHYVGGDIESMSKQQMQELFEESPWFGSTANDIDWMKRIEIQSVIQKYVTHSISSTINLPNDVSEETVGEIYMEAWKKGLKGITVYRDGSRSGVLVSSDATTDSNFEYIDAVKRPKDVPVDIHVTSSNGKKYNVFVGLIDDKPYEVFITDYFTKETSLILTKIKKGRYDLIKDGETYSEDITTEMNEFEEAITRLTSSNLRHGSNVKFVVEQLQKTPGDMFGFTKSIARVLKKYIPDGEESTVTCQEPDCGSTNVVFQEGCSTCKDCGSSKCG